MCYSLEPLILRPGRKLTPDGLSGPVHLKRDLKPQRIVRAADKALIIADQFVVQCSYLSSGGLSVRKLYHNVRS
jgi:hypothetical protein